MSFLIRIVAVFATAFAGFYTILYSVFVLLLVFTGLAGTIDFFIYYWSRVINFIARIDVKVSGLENLPEGPCLLVFNHQSLFDIPIVLSGVRKRIRFGAKKELFKIPIFGQAMKIVGVLKINRGDRADAVETLKKACERIQKNGESFILAAEGTRQKENLLGDFKSGPFILAIEAQCPIVPVVIKGAFDVLPKNELFFRLEHAHSVTLQVLAPIPTTGLKIQDRQIFKNKVREIMLKVFQSP